MIMESTFGELPITVDLTPGDRSSILVKRTSQPFGDYQEQLSSLDSHGTPYEDEELDELYDEMGELSDSQSTQPSFSRPTTPLQPSLNPPVQTAATSPSPPPTQPPEPYSLAHKAEKILGLSPGTLAHARAALENARDEVRRTADSPTNSDSGKENSGYAGMRNRMSRAGKKVMAAASAGLGGDNNSHGGNGGHHRTMSVQVGVGGKEEEEKRERRRRAADGVLYWQREVERLEAEEQAQVPVKAGRRR